MTEKELQQMIDEHWEYVESICEKMYKDGFKHGFKHGKQDNGED